MARDALLRCAFALERVRQLAFDSLAFEVETFDLVLRGHSVETILLALRVGIEAYALAVLFQGPVPSPLKPLPVLIDQLPVLSHCASLSQTVPVSAEATGAVASGAPTTAPAMAVRARVRPVFVGARCRPR